MIRSTNSRAWRAPNAPQHTHDGPKNERARHAGASDDQRYPSAIEHARKQVATNRVGADQCRSEAAGAEARSVDIGPIRCNVGASRAERTMMASNTMPVPSGRLRDSRPSIAGRRVSHIAASATLTLTHRTPAAGRTIRSWDRSLLREIPQRSQPRPPPPGSRRCDPSCR